MKVWFHAYLASVETLMVQPFHSEHQFGSQRLCEHWRTGKCLALPESKQYSNRHVDEFVCCQADTYTYIKYVQLCVLGLLVLLPSSCKNTKPPLLGPLRGLDPSTSSHRFANQMVAKFSVTRLNSKVDSFPLSVLKDRNFITVFPRGILCKLNRV